MRVNLDKPATLVTVNAVFRTLGFTEDELEFVRGEGYCYLAGDIPRAFVTIESGFYGDGSFVNRRTVRAWVKDALFKLALQAEWLCEDEFTARVARARAEFAAL